MAMIGRLAIAVWMAGASMALAQQPPAVPKPPPATPGQIAAAKANGEQLIARTQVGDLFETVPGSPSTAIRHKASGLVCNFTNNDPVGSIQIYPGKPRGDDISCGSKIGDFIITLYATRIAGPADVQDLMRPVVAAIQARHADLKPFTGHDVAKMTAPFPMPASTTARFVYSENGQDWFTRASLAVSNGWVIEERETAPLEHAIAGQDVIGEAMFVTALVSVVHPDMVSAAMATNMPNTAP
jgi:hypothetical protein